LQPAFVVGEKLDLTVVDMRFVKPLDEELLSELAKTHDGFVTIEDGTIQGGAGSACLEYFVKQGKLPHVLQLGLPDEFIDQGEVQVLMRDCGLDAEGIERSIRSQFNI